MEQLPVEVPELIRQLNEVFMEEDTKGLKAKIANGSIQYYLGQRDVIDLLNRLLKEEEDKVNVFS